jgi:xanthine dehydrogenase/oxidase
MIFHFLKNQKITLKELLWGDENNKWIKPGHLHSSGVGNYVIPSYYNIPSDFRVHLYDKSVNPRAIHSSKAIGKIFLFLFENS